MRSRSELAAEADASSGGPSMQQLIGSLESRLSKQLSDIDRKLEMLAVDMGSGLDQIDAIIQRGQRHHSRHHSRLPSRHSSVPMPPESRAPSMGPLSGDLQMPLSGWLAAHCSGSTGGPNYASSMGMQSGPSADGTLPERPIFVRSNTGHRSGATSSTRGESTLPECLMRRGATTGSLESSLSPLSALVARVRPSDHAQQIWTFLEDPDSSRGALWYSRIWSPFIAVSVMITFLQTLEQPVFSLSTSMAIELAFDIIFLLEVILRYCVCPSTCAFLRNPHNIIDVLAAAPIAVRGPCFAEARECIEDTWTGALLMNFAPILRLLKTLRHFKQFYLFLRLLNSTREALSVLLFTLCILVLVFSSLVYLVEPRDNISSLPQAMYLVIVTISTVGYGDVTPQTSAGSAVISSTILCSVLYMAMPIGIIGNAFTQIWSDRDRILLTIRTRERLMQWGYTAKDMQQLFKHFDRNQNGELTLTEFRKMIAEMRIGIQDQDDRVVQLFESFDRDGSGGIDEREFTRALFPSTYHEIYTHVKGNQEREVLDHARLLRLGFPRRRERLDSKKSDCSVEVADALSASPSAVAKPEEGSKASGETEKEAAPAKASHRLPLPGFNFSSSRSRSRNGSENKTNESESGENGKEAPTSAGESKEPGQSGPGPMDLQPLFSVCC